MKPTRPAWWDERFETLERMLTKIEQCVDGMKVVGKLHPFYVFKDDIIQVARGEKPPFYGFCKEGILRMLKRAHPRIHRYLIENFDEELASGFEKWKRKKAKEVAS